MVFAITSRKICVCVCVFNRFLRRTSKCVSTANCCPVLWRPFIRRRKTRGGNKRNIYSLQGSEFIIHCPPHNSQLAQFGRLNAHGAAPIKISVIHSWQGTDTRRPLYLDRELADTREARRTTNPFIEQRLEINLCGAAAQATVPRKTGASASVDGPTYTYIPELEILLKKNTLYCLWSSTTPKS